MRTRIFVTASFAKFAKKERIEDTLLVEAIERVESGLVDADLGGGVLKLRVARKGAGRRSGYRTIVACVVGRRAFFLYGFGKNDLANVGNEALRQFRMTAGEFQALSDDQLDRFLNAGTLREIIR